MTRKGAYHTTSLSLLVSTALGIGRDFKTFHPFFLSDKKIDGLGTHLFIGIGRDFKTFHPFFLSDKKIDGLGTHLFIDSSAYVLMRVRLFATPWIVAHQAPLSVEFSKQEHWSGLPLQGIFPAQGSNLHLLCQQADSLPLSHQ